MSKLLAREDVGEVHLHRHDLHRLDRISDRERGVRVGAGVDDQTVPVAVLVNGVHELALVVRLDEGQFDAERVCAVAQQQFDVGDRLAPVDLRGAMAEQVQVGPLRTRMRTNGDPPGEQATSAAARSASLGAPCLKLARAPQGGADGGPWRPRVTAV